MAINSSNFRDMQLRKEWHLDCKFDKSLLLPRFSLTLVIYIPYNINFRFHNGPDMLLVLAYFLGQFWCLFLTSISAEVCKLFLPKKKLMTGFVFCVLQKLCLPKLISLQVNIYKFHFI